MGIICSCVKNFKSRSSDESPLELDSNILDDTVNNDSGFLNRISVITKNQNLIDDEQGPPNIIAKRYKIIGGALHIGGFGSIYGAIDLEQNLIAGQIEIAANFDYAAKVEQVDDNWNPQLLHEYKLYEILEGGKGIPRAYAYEEYPHHRILVLEMLGNSLQQCYWDCNNKFSVKTVLMCAEQMIDRVQYIHERNFVHRDLKPDNFAIGLPGSHHENTIFILDFGFGKRWRNYMTREKRPFIKRYRGLVGTEIFAARSAHDGWEQGRKDDLESLGYVFLYLLSALPWQRNNFEGLNTEAYLDEVHNLKRNLSLKNYGKHIPKEFIQYLKYTRNLDFNEEPDYQYLRELFRKRARKLDIDLPYDNNFDWNT